MSVDPNKPDKPEADDNPWAVAMGAGTELVVSVLGGFLVGQWLDGKFKTAPWLMLLGAFFGITVGLYLLIKGSNERLKRRAGRR